VFSDAGGLHAALHHGSGFCTAGLLVGHEHHDGRDPDQDVDDAGDEFTLPAEENPDVPSDRADQEPVEGSDNDERG